MNTPLILDGKALAKSVEQELAVRVERIKENRHYADPGDDNSWRRSCFGNICEDEGQCLCQDRDAVAEGRIAGGDDHRAVDCKDTGTEQ